MSVFDVFYILQMVPPNRATHHIYLKEAWEVRKFIKKNSDRDLENSDDLKVWICFLKYWPMETILDVIVGKKVKVFICCVTYLFLVFFPLIC